MMIHSATCSNDDEDYKKHTSLLFVILNASSGGGNAQRVTQILATIFSNEQQPYELHVCQRPSDLLKVTKKVIEKASVCHGVVAGAGGDGTIRFIAQEVLAAGLRFGVIPLGTFNYFARDNGVPLDVSLATEALVSGIKSGKECKVQVGHLNDQIFLVNASLGLYPQLLLDRESLKKQHGRSRIVAKFAALVTLLKRDIKMQLHIEYHGGQHQSGESIFHASTIFVGNNALQLADIGLKEEAKKVTDGHLAIIALPPMSLSERVLVAFHSLLGMLQKVSQVTHFACSQLNVEPLSRRHKRMVKVAMDGELAHMQPPLTFRVGPTPLRLVVPVLPEDHH